MNLAPPTRLEAFGAIVELTPRRSRCFITPEEWAEFDAADQDALRLLASKRNVTLWIQPCQF